MANDHRRELLDYGRREGLFDDVYRNEDLSALLASFTTALRRECERILPNVDIHDILETDKRKLWKIDLNAEERRMLYNVAHADPGTPRPPRRHAPPLEHFGLPLLLSTANDQRKSKSHEDEDWSSSDAIWTKLIGSSANDGFDPSVLQDIRTQLDRREPLKVDLNREAFGMLRTVVGAEHILLQTGPFPKRKRREEVGGCARNREEEADFVHSTGPRKTATASSTG